MAKPLVGGGAPNLVVAFPVAFQGQRVEVGRRCKVALALPDFPHLGVVHPLAPVVVQPLFYLLRLVEVDGSLLVVAQQHVGTADARVGLGL